MRLIDADAFISSLNEYIDKPFPIGLCATLVELFPTAYDVDKVVEELQKIGTSYCSNAHCNNECRDCEHGCLMRTIISTVKRGEENENE